MIRNIVYLDSYKLRSISSQVFEGVTESVVKTSSQASESSESQKGPISSGKLLGDIFSRKNSSSELVFMEDYAYSILEDRLIADGAVDFARDDAFDGGQDKSFVLVTAKLNFNDLAKTVRVLRDFNEIGEAMWRMGNEPMGPLQGDRKILGDTEARRKAAEAGLQLHKKVTDAAARLIDFGFGDMLEASMSVGTTLFTAPLKRSALRDSEDMFLHKYSRVSGIEFTMLGLITKRGSEDGESASLPDVADADGLKAALRNLGLHVGTIERFFTGALEGEIVLDPIAIYSSI